LVDDLMKCHLQLVAAGGPGGIDYVNPADDPRKK
jgi:hypothetical protein